MKVVDASALIKYLNREKGWREVEEHLLEGCATISLAFKELCNALWKRVVRGELREEQVLKVLKYAVEGRIVKIFDQERLLEDALRLSVKMNLPVYDSLYIALARNLKTDLITSDKRQAEVAEAIGVRATLL